MIDPGAPEATALELRESLRRGDVSSSELVRLSLERAEQYLGLGAFTELRPELALEHADAADRRIASTRRDERHALPPLLGLPTAHKDLVRVQGFTTTHGSAAVPHLIADRDDPIAAAVRAAGAICIGKTQVPEFGIAGYSENLITQPARNPHDPERTSGGSSGGTATAVASGVIPAAIGSDGGGSIRIPAAACGLVGLKPGRGTVPADAMNGTVDELGAPRLAVSGPLARTARDAALFFDAALGNTHEPALRAVERAHELGGLRVGVSLDSPFAAQMPILFDAAATEALGEAILRLESFGHRIESAEIDYGTHYAEAFTTVWTHALTRIGLDTDAEARLGELAQWFLHRARSVAPQELALRVQQLNEFARGAGSQWAAYDVVLTPALAFDAPLIGEFWALGPEGDYRLQCEWAPQTSMVNVAGLPAIAVPVSADERGLPRGVQLIGRKGSETQLLQLAMQLLGE